MFGSQAKKLATRHQYGQLNYSEGGTPDEFGGYEDALRAVARKVNVGNVYVIPQKQVGGVLARDNGILRSNHPFRGILRANLIPSGVAGSFTYLNQWAGTPTRWDGDTPLTLQQQNTRDAPWLANVRRFGSNLVGTFDSGTSKRTSS